MRFGLTCPIVLFVQQPLSSNNGPFSAPPGKTTPPVWPLTGRISNRCHSVPADDNLSPPLDQDQNVLYDNYPPAAVTGESMVNMPSVETADKEPQRPSSPPQPPERKFLPTGDQLVVSSTSLWFVCYTWHEFGCSSKHNIHRNRVRTSRLYISQASLYW